MAAAALLRLHRIGDFATFLSDQGRDAIIIKRIVTFIHWPAIGPPSSVGQIYLGPFYYYLMAPFLALFKLNPVGLAYGSAFLSLAGLITGYLIVKKFIDQNTAHLFLILAAFSQVNIQAARFSWNPNPLAIFSFITLFFLFQFIKSNRPIFAFLFGFFFGCSFQLHHLSALMAFTFLPFLIYQLFDSRDKLKIISRWLVALLGFVLISSPLIIFDIRHGFLNSRNLFKLLTQNDVASHSNLISKITQTVNYFFNFGLAVNISQTLTTIIFVLIIISLLLVVRMRKVNAFLAIHWINFIFYLVLFSFVNGPRYPHYFGPVYFSFFLILAYVLSQITYRLMVCLFLAGYIFINLVSLFSKPPAYQIQHAQKVANFLAEKIGNRPFNIATWPVELTEDNYLYFLELKGLMPADRTKIEITQQLFVLCNQQPCRVLESPSWNISMFGPAKIDRIWTIDNVTIYKLIHAR